MSRKQFCCVHNNIYVSTHFFDIYLLHKSKWCEQCFLAWAKHSILFRISKYSSQCNARSVNEMHNHTNNWNIKSPFAEKNTSQTIFSFIDIMARIAIYIIPKNQIHSTCLKFKAFVHPVRRLSGDWVTYMCIQRWWWQHHWWSAYHPCLL